MNGMAVSSPSFSIIPVEKMAPAIFEHFHTWEIVAEHKHHLGIAGRFLKEYMASHDVAIQVHAPLSDINIAAFSDRVREASVTEVLEAVKGAAGLGAKVVTFHPGHLSPAGQLDRDRVMRLNRESVLRIARAGVEHGVPLAIENMPKMRVLAFQRPAELLECIEGTEVGLCLDIGHAHTNGNLEDFFALAPLLRNIHIHDNTGGWDEHMVLGKGTASIERAVSALKPAYRHAWVIEAQNLAEGLQSKEILERLLS